MSRVPSYPDVESREEVLAPPGRLRSVPGVIRRNPLLAVGAAMCVAIFLVAVLAPLIATYPEDAGSAVHPLQTLEPPSAQHYFGTDQVGRDVFSRVVYGARISPVIAVLVLTISVLIGVPLGIAAGYFGGWIDEAISRVTDIFLAFPALLLALAFAAVMQPSITNTVIAISITWWPWYTRIVRGQAASVTGRPFVESAKATGVPHRTILLRHILPNSITPIIVQVSLDVGGVILTASALSFLGLGAQDPTPDWGLMVSQGQAYFTTQWWLVTFPGAAIFLTAVAFNLLGDGLRDVLDPPKGADDAMTEAKLSISQLQIAFGRRTVVDLELLELGSGEILGLAGESGSGKSITALAVLGLAATLGARVEGSVRLDGEELVGAPGSRLREIRGSRISMIFQSPVSSLDPLLQVGELFERTLRLHGVRKREASERASNAFREVLLSPDLLERFPHELSGGQAQRIAIAMALALHSEVLLADEPTSALDVTVQAEILDLLRRVREERGMSVLFISHDLAVIAELCDRVAVMQLGRIVEEGPTEQVLGEPEDDYTKQLVAAVPKIGAQA